MATGRKAKTEALGYIAKKSNRIKVTNAGNKVNAMAAGYSGRTSLKQLMHDMGYTNTSTKTNLVKVTKDILIDEDYIEMLDEAFYKSLPGTYGSFNKSPDVNSIITEATDELGTELIGLSKETIKGQRLDKKAENIEKEKNIGSKKKKGKINTDNAVIKNLMKGAGVDEEQVKDMNFKDLYDKYKANLKSGGQKFMSDAIQGTKTFLSGIQEGAMENYDDQVKAIEANRGKPPLEKFMLGAGEAIGMSGRLIGKAARFVKPNIRDVAEREASDITGADAIIKNEADQQKMQEQMAAIEDSMVNVPEEDVVPETTEEKTQRELSQLGF